MKQIELGEIQLEAEKIYRTPDGFRGETNAQEVFRVGNMSDEEIDALGIDFDLTEQQALAIMLAKLMGMPAGEGLQTAANMIRMAGLEINS